ncbi:MAG: hypothetical protein IRZ16_22190 [Myxococcaceae bacterium]|nr:hypothetical protein [Myxococcaceae bacterium]
MTPEERQETERRAERCVRRGELSEALALYRALAAAFPEDSALQQKLEAITGSLQPAELLNPKANFVREEVELKNAPSTPEQEGERLFALGDYAGAAAAYRRAMEKKPESTLIRERLEELYRLARAAPRHSPTDSALPADPAAMLSALLDRIAARRRA